MPSHRALDPGSLDLDHVAHFVADMDSAGQVLLQLGFTLTPFSAQSHRLTPDGPLVDAGTGNRCVMLQSGYLEILTPTGSTPLARQLQDAIARYVGVHLIAFGTAAPDRDHVRLAAHGFEPLAPVALQRPISTPSGEDTARFTVVRVPPGVMAEGRIQFCQHHTPALVWQKRWIEHRNGATALASVWLCVPDAAEAAHRYGRFTGLPVTRSAPNVWTLDAARGTLVFVEPATLEQTLGIPAATCPWIAGYTLETADLDAVRELAVQAQLAPRELGDGRVLVALPPTVGGVIIFAPRASGTSGAVLQS